MENNYNFGMSCYNSDDESDDYKLIIDEENIQDYSINKVQSSSFINENINKSDIPDRNRVKSVIYQLRKSVIKFNVNYTKKIAIKSEENFINENNNCISAENSKSKNENFKEKNCKNSLQKILYPTEHLCNICNRFYFSNELLEHFAIEHNNIDSLIISKDIPNSSTKTRGYNNNLFKYDKIMDEEELINQVKKLVQKVVLGGSHEFKYIYYIEYKPDDYCEILYAGCKKCRKIFSNRGLKMLQQHLRDCYLLYRFICQFCDMKFQWEIRLKGHLARKHQIRQAILCHKCSRIFKNQTHLNSHIPKCHGTITV